jgi:hypothetical protein
MRWILAGIRNRPHPEEGAERPSRRTLWRKSGAVVAAAMALSLCSCTPPPEPPHPLVPLGVRQTVRPGEWQGPMGGTMIDFHIDQVSPGQVYVHISGTVIQPLSAQQKQQGHESYFYDRPKICPKRADGLTFDCPHYADMHIDNGLLCGTYTLESLVYRPCFLPVR